MNLASNGGQTVAANSNEPGVAAVLLKVNYVTSGGLIRFLVGSDETNRFLYLLSGSTSISSKVVYKGSILHRVFIDDRPAIVDEKKRSATREWT